jgi:hypothetical protein
MSVERLYRIRMGLDKFNKDAFIGLDESMDSLGERDVEVHLLAIETERGIVSVWMTDASSPPVGVIIARFA